MEQSTIKTNLKQLIKQSDKKQYEICEEAGINYVLFSQYMNDENRRIPATWIGKIAPVINRSTDEIYGLK